MSVYWISVFFRCHAGYIVNMDYIGKICGEEIFLITEDKVYISRQKRKEFIKVYGEYLGTKKYRSSILRIYQVSFKMNQLL